jgi:hypothetical protein
MNCTHIVYTQEAKQLSGALKSLKSDSAKVTLALVRHVLPTYTHGVLQRCPCS